MLVEVTIAVNYILSHLYTKLPRRRVDSFGEELERYLHAKYQQHWFPADPMRDAAYRCLNVGGPQVDLLLPEAAAVSGLDWSEIQACLPEGLVLSIDPGHVACQYHQPQFTAQEFNRYPGAPMWPSASVSLSSSGCSSASSSISSTNLTPTSNQITHQVLYCFQDNWFGNSGNPWSDGINGQNKATRPDAEQGDNLATATALSVLVDTEDNLTSNLPSDLIQKPLADVGFNGNGLTMNASNSDSTNMTHLLFRDAELKTVSTNGLDMLNGSDNRLATGNLLWPNPTDNKDTENSLLTLMNGDLSSNLTATTQVNSFGEKTRTPLPLLNRSSSNPPQTDQSNLPLFHDYPALSAGNLNNTGNALGPSMNKFDLNGNPNFTGPIQPRINAVYAQSTLSQLVNTSGTNHFVQKSVSTPSFTAATFAQTKFGSTKLKTHSKRTPNRILSPTTVPQTFAAYTGSNLSGRDSINVTSMGPAQRISHGTGLDLNPVQRLLPTSMELSLSQNGKIISPVDLPLSFEAVERSSGLGTSAVNMVQKKLFPYTGITQPSKEGMQSTLFDGLFSSAIDETKNPEELFANLNYSEALTQSAQNSNKFWPNASVPFYRDASNCVATGFLNGTDWLTASSTYSPADALSNQQSSKTISSHGLHITNMTDNQATGKIDDPVDLSDDAFLSTRMVSLLLDEDTNVDPIKDSQNASIGLSGNNSETAHTLTNSKPVSVLESISTELGALKSTCPE